MQEHIFERMARERNISVEEMRAIISKRIEQGWNSNDPVKREQWRKIPWWRAWCFTSWKWTGYIPRFPCLPQRNVRSSRRCSLRKRQNGNMQTSLACTAMLFMLGK